MLLVNPVALLPIALACQRFLGSALLAGLQVKRVAFDLFDDVLLLHFALKPAQRALQSLTFLHVYFSQLKSPPLPVKQFGAELRQ
jgi:hypothetical protein